MNNWGVKNAHTQKKNHQPNLSYIAIVCSLSPRPGLAKTSMQQLFAVMTAVQISLEILLNQMREASVYHHPVIDSDKCWSGSDVSMMKKLLAKLLIMSPPPPDKVSRGKPQPTNGRGESSTHINSNCRIPPLGGGEGGGKVQPPPPSPPPPTAPLSGILHN